MRFVPRRLFNYAGRVCFVVDRIQCALRRFLPTTSDCDLKNIFPPAQSRPPSRLCHKTESFLFRYRWDNCLSPRFFFPFLRPPAPKGGSARRQRFRAQVNRGVGHHFGPMSSGPRACPTWYSPFRSPDGPWIRKPQSPFGSGFLSRLQHAGRPFSVSEFALPFAFS